MWIFCFFLVIVFDLINFLFVRLYFEKLLVCVLVYIVFVIVKVIVVFFIRFLDMGFFGICYFIVLNSDWNKVLLLI